MFLSENEKLIWAAAYAAEWVNALARREMYGAPMSVSTCIENAGSAVTEARDAHAEVQEEWGRNNPVCRMLNQMTKRV